MKTLAIFLATFLLQQSPAPAPQTVIEGTVLNSANAPVAGAEVTAFWSSPPARYSSGQIPRTVTDQSGRFVFRNLAVGGYLIGVRAPGYVAQQYGKVVTLDAERVSQTIAMSLASEGVVSGRVTSASGSPLVKMEVRALRKVYDAHGWSSFSPAGNPGETNDRGEYRITGLGPGRYYILALSPFAGRQRIEAGRAEREGRAAPPAPSAGEYAPTFFPGVSDISAAVPVDLQSGLALKDFDLVLPRLQLFKIRGSVRESGGGLPSRRVSLGVVPAAAAFVSGLTMSIAGPAYDREGNLISAYRPDGTFELTDIPAGTYWLNAQLEGGRPSPEELQLLSTPGFDFSQLPPPSRGATLLRVIDSDVSNADVVILNDLSLSGSVSVEGTATAPMAAMRLEMHPIAIGQTASAIGRTAMSAGGNFTHSGLAAAEYRVAFSGLPQGFYVKEARLGGIDALAGVLLLNRQPLPALEVRLAKGYEVSGAVSDAGTMSPNQEVVLIPEGLSNRPDLYRTATTNVNGAFTMEGVAPGNYRAFAWKAMEPFRYFDPEFVREFEKQGAEVRVVEGTSAVVSVNLIR